MLLSKGERVSGWILCGLLASGVAGCGDAGLANAGDPSPTVGVQSTNLPPGAASTTVVSPGLVPEASGQLAATVPAGGAGIANISNPQRPMLGGTVAAPDGAAAGDPVDASAGSDASASGASIPMGAESGAEASCIDCGDYVCDGTPLRFLAHGQASAEDETPFDAAQVGGALSLGDPNYYQCFYFEAPWDKGAQATGFKPIIDNSRVLHHWLLYASAEAPIDIVANGMRGECQLQSDPNRTLLAGWAPGTPGQNMPDHVGQELPQGGRTFVTLEIHYYNTQPGMPAMDRSGAEICLSNEQRPDTATQHWLGTEKIAVPPGETATTTELCTPGLAPGQTSTLLRLTPHMHLTGVHTKLELLRVDGSIEVLHDKPFAFENQTTYFLDPPVVVNAGDRLRTSCTYRNEGSTPVNYGEGSEEEMCYLYTTAYPAGSLHNGLNGCFGPFCVPGGTRRCIDTESIGDALGGL